MKNLQGCLRVLGSPHLQGAWNSELSHIAQVGPQQLPASLGLLCGVRPWSQLLTQPAAQEGPGYTGISWKRWLILEDSGSLTGSTRRKSQRWRRLLACKAQTTTHTAPTTGRWRCRGPQEAAKASLYTVCLLPSPAQVRAKGFMALNCSLFWSGNSRQRRILQQEGRLTHQPTQPPG